MNNLDTTRVYNYTIVEQEEFKNRIPISLNNIPIGLTATENHNRKIRICKTKLFLITR